jgi:hypothetical protein
MGKFLIRIVLKLVFKVSLSTSKILVHLNKKKPFKYDLKDFFKCNEYLVMLQTVEYEQKIYHF